MKARHQLDDDGYADLLDFAVQLSFGGYSPATLLPQVKKSIETLEKQEGQAARWSFEIAKDYRPQMTLVSEENGQAIPLIMMLGEAGSVSGKASEEGHRHWILYNVTSDKTQRRYHGHSTKAGREGTIEAIRNAFVDFRENAEYGRGTIAIRLPQVLHDDLGFTVPVDAAMRAAPGATARWMQRLENLAMAAGLAALVAATVLTGGAAAMALGAVAGVAGGIVAVHRMANRAEGDRLRLDYDTLMDVIAIVGAVASVVGPIASVAGSIGRASVTAAREAGNVSKLLKSATWVQRAEMTARGLHIFGIVQGIGQLVIQIPYDIIRQFDEIDKEERENPLGASPGQRRARRAMVLLNGFHTGVVTVVSLGQSLHEPAPKVTSDAEIWSLAGEAAGRPPTVPEPGARPAGPPADTAPPPAPKPEAEGKAGPRPIPVNVTPGAEQTAKGGGSEPAAAGDREGAAAGRPAPGPAGARPPTRAGRARRRCRPTSSSPAFAASSTPTAPLRRPPGASGWWTRRRSRPRPGIRGRRSAPSTRPPTGSSSTATRWRPRPVWPSACRRWWRAGPTPPPGRTSGRRWSGP